MKQLDIKKLKENIEIRAAKNVAEANIGAAGIAVTQNDNTVYEGYFGEMTQQNGEKIGEKTMYRLASMSKPVTSAAIGILWSRKLISLDDKIEKYLPCFKDLHIRTLDANGNVADLGAVKTPPTVLHLLTHTSGIGSDAVFGVAANNFTSEEMATLESSMPAYAEWGTAFEPYTRQLYSPLEGFDILARIVEIISDMPYDEFLKKNIFTPCDMPDTTFAPTKEQWARMVVMHNKIDGKNAVCEMVEGAVFDRISTTHFSGGAGLAGTLPDYLHFAKMLLGKGEYNGFKVLSDEYISLMSDPQVPKSIMPGNERWGLGVRCVAHENYGRLPVGAFGWSGAYGTHFWVDPVNRITAVYMKNSAFDGGSGAITSAEFEQDVTSAIL
ncbi:MAG: beta-lactamase family protein [Clostridia bacterium]|nr:beta-lactamase family protein [Clostridia bacterium]